MQIQIKATKIELTDAIRDYVQKKADMLEKYIGSLPVINCHFEVGQAVGGQQSGEIFRAEMNLDLNGELLRIEKTEKDLYKAIDKVKDHMEREIIKFKEKARDK
jgi:putative sigma-54 modulation protein